MLKELINLLRKGDTIGLSIGCEADAGADPVAQPARFRINVLPKLFTLDGENGSDRKALNTPLTITGTADELDSPAFVDTITRFTTSVTETRHSIDEVVAAHKSALPKKSEPSKAAAKTNPTPKPVAGSARATRAVPVAPPGTPRTPSPVAAPKRSHHAPKPGTPAWQERLKKKGLAVAPSESAAGAPVTAAETISEPAPATPVEAPAATPPESHEEAAPAETPEAPVAVPAPPKSAKDATPSLI